MLKHENLISNCQLVSSILLIIIDLQRLIFVIVEFINKLSYHLYFVLYIIIFYTTCWNLRVNGILVVLPTFPSNLFTYTILHEIFLCRDWDYAYFKPVLKLFIQGKHSYYLLLKWHFFNYLWSILLYTHKMSVALSKCKQFNWYRIKNYLLSYKCSRAMIIYCYIMVEYLWRLLKHSRILNKNLFSFYHLIWCLWLLFQQLTQVMINIWITMIYLHNKDVKVSK
jgi:hypothetical protein